MPLKSGGITKALATENMDLRQYSVALAIMIESGIHFTTVDTTFLSQIAEEENWKPSERLIRVLETLSGENSDMVSSARVGLRFVSAIWQKNMSLRKKRRLTEDLLGILVRNGEVKARGVLRAFVKFSTTLGAEHGDLFKRCIEDWAGKHSISLSSRPLTRLEKFGPNVGSLRSFLMATTSLTS